MFNPGSVLGSTFYASREPVRNPLSLKLLEAAKAIGSAEPSLIGSVGHRLVRGFIVTTDATLCNVHEPDIIEVTDYDPVRKTSLVIGLKEPTRYVALHWLALQTNPEKLATMFLFVEKPPPGAKVFTSKLLQGSFEQALEAAKALKECKDGMLFIDGGGLMVVAKDLQTLVHDFKDLVERTRPSKRPKHKDKAPAKKAKK